MTEAENTDIQLLVDYLGNRVFVTQGREGLGLEVGGYVIVMPVAAWHALARTVAAKDDESAEMQVDENANLQ